MKVRWRNGNGGFPCPPTQGNCVLRDKFAVYNTSRILIMVTHAVFWTRVKNMSPCKWSMLVRLNVWSVETLTFRFHFIYFGGGRGGHVNVINVTLTELTELYLFITLSTTLAIFLLLSPLIWYFSVWRVGNVKKRCDFSDIFNVINVQRSWWYYSLCFTCSHHFQPHWPVFSFLFLSDLILNFAWYLITLTQSWNYHHFRPSQVLKGDNWRVSDVIKTLLKFSRTLSKPGRSNFCMIVTLLEVCKVTQSTESLLDSIMKIPPPSTFGGIQGR